MVKVSGIDNLNIYKKSANLTNSALNFKAELNNPVKSTKEASNNKDLLDSKENIHKVQDEIVSSDLKTRFRVGITKLASQPEYIIRGLKGDPDANFFEFLQLAKIPYYIGGPVLAWCFAAGGKAAKPIAAQKAVGVGLFYLAASLAGKLINLPVKAFRGVDLDQSYKKIARLRAQNPDGLSPMRKEYHKVYESIDFTYLDLLRNSESNSVKKHRLVNKNFDQIASKMGIDKNLNDSDSAVKPYIKKLIIMSRAWKYALTLPLTALAIGLSSQDSWKNLGNALKGDFIRNSHVSKEGLNLLQKTLFSIKGVGLTLKGHLWNTLKSSVKDFWNGAGAKGISKVFGKAAIIGSIGTALLANIVILKASSLKDKKIVDVAEFPNIPKEKRENLLKNAFEIVAKSNTQENHRNG